MQIYIYVARSYPFAWSSLRENEARVFAYSWRRDTSRRIAWEGATDTDYGEMCWELVMTPPAWWRSTNLDLCGDGMMARGLDCHHITRSFGMVWVDRVLEMVWNVCICLEQNHLARKRARLWWWLVMVMTDDDNGSFVLFSAHTISPRPTISRCDVAALYTVWSVKNFLYRLRVRPKCFQMSELNIYEIGHIHHKRAIDDIA